MKSPARYRPPWERHSVAAVLALGAVALCFGYPFVWMFLSSFKTNPEIYRPMQLWPETFQFEAWRRLWSGEWFPVARVICNSTIVALTQSVGAVAVCSLAGYGFGRHRWRGRTLWFAVTLAAVVLPLSALAIPLFPWINALGLSDRLAGVVLPGMASGLGVLYFTHVFRQMPDSLVEAARLEGAEEWRVYWMLLPLARSATISFGLVHFILAWHDHLVPLLILSSPEKQTLPLALAWLNGSSLRYPVAALMAASALAVLPTAILFLALGRKFKTALKDLMTS